MHPPVHGKLIHMSTLGALHAAYILWKVDSQYKSSSIVKRILSQCIALSLYLQSCESCPHAISTILRLYLVGKPLIAALLREMTCAYGHGSAFAVFWKCLLAFS